MDKMNRTAKVFYKAFFKKHERLTNRNGSVICGNGSVREKNQVHSFTVSLLIC
jgi:hypothetical protein